MSEWDEYLIESESKEKWSANHLREFINDLIEDYHWERVAPLIEQLEELGQKPRKGNEYVYRPNINGKYPMDRYRRFFTSLGLQMFHKGFIKKESINVFISAFNGVGLPEGNNKVEWLKEKNLCTHLIDELVDRKIITDRRRDINTEIIFGIKNPAQTRQSYYRNLDMKPKKYRDIDNLLDIADRNSDEEYNLAPDK